MAASPTDRPTTAELTMAVSTAVRAPSIHNTQPWRWTLLPDGLELRADRSRQLQVLDLDAHALTISCGAALWLARLALRAQGWREAVEYLPEPREQDLLARVRVTRREKPPPGVDTRLAAARNRYTERRQFAPGAVPDRMVDPLRGAALDAGGDAAVCLHVPRSPDELRNLAEVVWRADADESVDPGYQEELAGWLRPDGAARDGIPPAAVPRATVGEPRYGDFPVRDFAPGADGQRQVAGRVLERPLIGVLLTPGDGRLDRLRAGEALAAVLVEAEMIGLAASPVSQPVDWPVWRYRLRQLMGWSDCPQMILRLGWRPEDQNRDHPLTGRRPVGDILDDPPGR
ncbi:MAG: Acg family FMN-binding oxidoreductase [Mycobacteriales bacterium]